MSANLLIIPSEALGSVEMLLALPAEKLRDLRGLLAAPQGEEPSRQHRRLHQSIAQVARVSAAEGIEILEAVRNIRRQRRRFEIDRDSLLVDLRTIVAGTEIEPQFDDPNYLDALDELLTSPDEDIFDGRVADLRGALAPELEESRTIVDARPLFSANRETIEAMVLTTHLVLTATTRSGEEVVSTFALSEAALTSLIKTLNEAKSKRSKLEEYLPESPRRVSR